MNKLFFLLFFIGILPLSYSQNNIGFKLGMNIASVSKNGGHNPPFINFNTGVVGKFKLQDELFLNTELLLSNKGFNSLFIPSGTTPTKLTYLSIPVLLESKTKKSFYFQMGPEFNFLINAKEKYNGAYKTVYADYKKFDITIATGFGFKLFNNFSLEARYSFGLLQINQSSRQTRTFQLSLLYKLKPKQ